MENSKEQTVDMLEVEDNKMKIEASLSNIEGQMVFFTRLIEDCDEHPEISAVYMKQGAIQKQLSAIRALFQSELDKIKKANEGGSLT